MAVAGPGGTPFEKTRVEAAKTNLPLSPAVTKLADESARREEQANDQRAVLFWVVLGVIAFMLVVVVLCVFMLGAGWIHLSTPVAVAFISGACVQSLLLVATLARGLYARPEPSKSSSPEVE